MPHDYVPDPDDSDYDSTDHRHGIDYGHGMTNLLKSAQTTFLHGTELEAATFEVSADYYLRTVI